MAGVRAEAQATSLTGVVKDSRGTPQMGAVVQLLRPDFSVALETYTDDHGRYRIATIYDSPVEFELRAGRHKLQMIRNSRVVYEEYFSLDAGEQTVLIAWERPDVQLPIPTHPTVLTHRRPERCRPDRTASR